MPSILLVDDDPLVRASTRRVLERSGHTVIEVGDGFEAIQVVAEGPVDLVVTDILMPDIDGIRLILELREQRPEIPIVAISGGGKMVALDLLLADAEELGAVACIPKPFEIDELLDAVARALGSGSDQ